MKTNLPRLPEVPDMQFDGALSCEPVGCSHSILPTLTQKQQLMDTPFFKALQDWAPQPRATISVMSGTGGLKYRQLSHALLQCGGSCKPSDYSQDDSHLTGTPMSFQLSQVVSSQLDAPTLTNRFVFNWCCKVEGLDGTEEFDGLDGTRWCSTVMEGIGFFPDFKAWLASPEGLALAKPQNGRLRQCGGKETWPGPCLVPVGTKKVPKTRFSRESYEPRDCDAPGWTITIGAAAYPHQEALKDYSPHENQRWEGTYVYVCEQGHMRSTLFLTERAYDDDF